MLFQSFKDAKLSLQHDLRAVTLVKAFQNYDAFVYLRFRTNGKVFDLTRFNSRSKVFPLVICEILNAEDSALVVTKEDDMQVIMSHLSGLVLHLEDAQL